MTFSNLMVSNLVGPVDGRPVGDAITVVVTVLSCGRLGFSWTASLPFLHMAGLLVYREHGGLRSSCL